MPVSFNNTPLFNYAVVAGPDKTALGGFLKHMRRVVGRAYGIGEMHSLMSTDSIGAFVEDFRAKNPKGIISYYARRKINVSEPLQVIPATLEKLSEVIIWFELYDPKPRLLKVSEKDSAFISEITGGWNKIINRT